MVPHVRAPRVDKDHVGPISEDLGSEESGTIEADFSRSGGWH